MNEGERSKTEINETKYKINERGKRNKREPLRIIQEK